MLGKKGGTLVVPLGDINISLVVYARDWFLKGKSGLNKLHGELNDEQDVSRYNLQKKCTSFEA